jgi:peptidylprolyl isomerase
MTGSKPVVQVPAGAPPADLEVVDLTVGEGEQARAGQTVSVHYVGVAYSNGKEFDSSWNRREPFSFRLGAGQVIAGWDRGVAGMRVGGRRQLTIPAHLAYGDRGAGGVIKPGETLIFVVDLLAVN